MKMIPISVFRISQQGVFLQLVLSIEDLGIDPPYFLGTIEEICVDGTMINNPPPHLQTDMAHFL